MSRPASAAGEEEEHAAWADALDVDDSGFRLRGPASSPSPLRSCATPRPDDPAPAASLAHDAARGLRSPLLASSGPAACGHGQATDPDFSLAPWLHALGSLGDARAWKRQEIAAIRGDRALCRARLVVGMVTSCTPNGLGDLFLSLKDPTGIIGASVHQKVFAKKENMVVSVGCVLVLKKVVVFRPSHKACYLNITEENLEMLVPKDFLFPSKQVFSSSPSESQHPVKCAAIRGSSCQGDNQIRKTGAETDGQTTANAVRDSTLKMDKGSTQGVENHQDIRLEKKDTNQQLQKKINSISQANCQQSQGSPCNNYGSRVESSTDNIMMRLLGGERIVPSSNKTVVAEVSCDHGGMPDANNSASRTDSDTGDSIEASFEEKLSRPLEGERMLPSSKKQRSDAVLPDNVMSSMNVETYGLANNLNMGMDVFAQDVHSSIKKQNEHQQKDFITGTLGIVLPTQENSSVSISQTTTVSASLHSQPNKMASVTEWTDDQLSELFADY